MTFIIADACVNWRNLNEADQIIKGCARAGADAVKFQAYEKFHETGGFYDTLNGIRLDENTIPYLYYRCIHHGVEFLCTPMYPGAVELLNPYVKRWKVRFKDRACKKILGACSATGKEIIISDDKAYNNISNQFRMYCIPEYPPKSLPDMKVFEGMDGYSCHIPIVNHAAFTAKMIQAKYLEVHVMLDKYHDDYEPIDQKVSLTVSELSRLVDLIRSNLKPQVNNPSNGGLLDNPNNWV
jgi:sialic acid synthase SpsE